VIRALYGASQAGVRIDLLVRGICCLRPGVPGVSENIRVTSVVDRFLEHSRVFAFGEGAQAEVWASSADWMPRNFVRRIETMFPVEDPLLRQRLLDEVLGVGLRDNAKARRLQRDGTYVPVAQEGSPVRSQMVLLELARRIAESKPIESLMRHVAAPEIPAEPLRPPATPVPVPQAS
jgi:polyphosphate kinase